MQTSPIAVSDLLSNYNDQLVTAAKIIGRSKDRQKVFEAVYRGKLKTKTIDFLKIKTGLSNIRILQEGGKMSPLLMEKTTNAYTKKPEFSTYYKKILGMVKDKKKTNRIPTKVKPYVKSPESISVSFPILAENAKLITIDDINSFSKVKGIVTTKIPTNFTEERIKKGFQIILGEKGIFKDWGGEKSDLYTTNFFLKNTRISTAVAFKGKGTKGKLVPAKMGKNGDQIGRLFEEPAQMFLIVYNGQINSSIISQMKAFAIAKTFGNSKRIYFGIIDGNDLSRLVVAYPKAFNLAEDSSY